uniref:Uncharacterized protein n=1 Tax=Alexandrium catenella TaxID=2925 RepID=A0A7S1WSR1_ALECA
MYVSQLRREALDVAKSLPAIRAYLQSAGLAYTDVLCPEVSPEDAFFWREAGRMECGFLRSRSVKRGHVCECFAGLHFAPASMRIAHSKGFVRCFTDTLRESGGPALDAGEVFLQVSLHDMVRILSSILSNAKPTYLKLEPQGWENICGREDPVLSSATGRSLELRRGLATVVDGIAAWRGLGYHGVLARWCAAVELLSLGDRLAMGWAPSVCARSARAGEHCDFLCG